MKQKKQHTLTNVDTTKFDTSVSKDNTTRLLSEFRKFTTLEWTDEYSEPRVSQLHIDAFIAKLYGE